jgi:hypothetical protein
VPALGGILLVAAFWWTRPLIGRVGALVAAILVMLSPLFVLHARAATEYALGPLLSLIIVVTVFAYLRNPRTVVAFPLIVSVALALLTDAQSVLTVAAVVLFVAVEATFFRGRELRGAWRSFRSSPAQWISALLVLAAGLQLGITRFGTEIGAGMPGLRLLGDMFDMPRDSRPADYFPAILVAYDWPVLLAGTAGFLLLAVRLVRRRGLVAFDRFLLLWTLIAAVALGLATRREAGQLLILLLPLVLLSGTLAQEVATRFEWAAVSRWWPFAAALAIVLALAALLMTQWSSDNASSGERVLLAATPLICLIILAVAAVQSRAGALAAAACAVSFFSLAFMTHSSLAVAFGDGSEYAVDARLTPRVEQLKTTLDRLSVERNSDIVMDAALVDGLGWTLRDSRVAFGGDPTDASVVLARPGAPPTLAELPDQWLITEGWYPEDVLSPRKMWRWMIYREPFGPAQFFDVRIYVRTI